MLTQVNMNINFNHLYYFYVIAREGSLAKATKVLKVSQPTLSQQLKHLEGELKQELFSRSGRSLKLNKHGEYLFSYARKIFGLASDMMTGFTYNQSINVDMTYRIGITPSLSRSFATRLLKPLFRDETIGLSIKEQEIGELIDQLHRFDLDFILADSPDSSYFTKGIERMLIKEPSYHFVCGNKFNREVNNIPADLNQAPYFKYSADNALQKDVDNFFFKHEVIPSVVGQSDDINIMLSATEYNHCFSVVPDVAAQDLIEEKRIRVLGEFKSENSNISALYLKEMDNDKVTKALDSIRMKF